MNPENDIHGLAANYLAGEMNRRQQRKFLRMLEEREDQKTEFLKLKKDWQKIITDAGDIQSDSRKAWNNLISRLDNDGILTRESESPRITPFNLMRLAAAVILLLAISIPSVLYFQGKNREYPINTYTAKEQTTSYDLPDGSRVFLKKGSEITLSQNFERNRNMNLRGEAWFDVMADLSYPFRITTGEAIISVLGTEFNVREDKPAGQTEVWVESGSVVVQGRRNKEEIILKPGEFAVSSRKEINREAGPLPNYLAWKTRIFEFDNEPLDEVFLLIEDVYQIEISVEDEAVNMLRLTSAYHKQSAEAVLKTISAAFGLNIVQVDDRYLVSVYP